MLGRVFGSPRKPREGLTQAMAPISVEPPGESKKEAETILQGTMPFRMSGKGLEAKAEEVQLFALAKLEPAL